VGFHILTLLTERKGKVRDSRLEDLLASDIHWKISEHKQGENTYH